jgi:two-component system, chemotaxis family, CheB/CheR fusion protein
VADGDRGEAAPEQTRRTVSDASDRRQIEDTSRRNERRLQQQKKLIDLSRDPVFVWDFDDGIVDWNRGSEELYGYSREEALGKSVEQLLGTTVPDSSFAALKANLVQEGSWAGELQQRTKDGRELIVESRLQLATFDGQRLVLESTRDVTARHAAERRLRGELTHRVRNTLAVILAVARHTLRNTQTREDFSERFEARLAALASAHTLLVGSDWKGADLAELARQQLAPYTSGDPNRFRLQGESIMLSADLATPFGLVLHELATAAAKHGSLSLPIGTVSLSWTITPRNLQRILKVVWQESRGPTVGEPGAGGLGAGLIDRVIPGAKVEREFRPDGFVCTIELALPEAAELENGSG